MWRRVATGLRAVAGSRRRAVALALLGLGTGCDGDGSAALYGGGTCPKGETCSRAVSGLSFLAARPHERRENGSLPELYLPAGGTDDVAFTPLGGAALPAADVLSSDEGVFVVESATVNGQSGTARIRAVAAGGAFLRVTEKGTQTLIGRASVYVSDAASVTLGPPGLGVPLTFGSIDYVSAGPWGLYAGSTSPVLLRVSDANGRLLVDTAADFAGPGVAKGPTWDQWMVLAPTTAGVLPMNGTVLGKPFSTTVAVATTIDAITPYPETWTGGTKDGAFVCFVPWSEGLRVQGAPMTFEAPSGAMIVQVESGDPCLAFPDPGSSGTLKVTMGGFSRSFELSAAK